MSEPAGRLRSLVRAVPAGVRRDYAETAVVQWSTLGINLLLFHLVAQRGGAAGFAYYQIARGVVAGLQPLALAGLGTAVQRYLPRAGVTATTLARRAFGVQLVLVAAVAAALLAPAGSVAGLLGLDGRGAVTAIVVLLAGNCVCTMAVAVLRGTGQARPANIAALTGFAVVPVVAFLPPAGIDTFVVRYGYGMAAVGLCAVALARSSPAVREQPQPTLATLLRYGLRRLPGDLALPALFAFPTVAVAHARPGGPEAGYVGFATSAVTLVCVFFGMLTPVLLPRLSAHFHRGDGGATLHRALIVLPLGAAGLAALFAVLIAVPAPMLVDRFLGTEFGPAVPVLRLGLLAAPPLAMFYAIRPTLDALQEAPVTAGLPVGCLAVQVLLTVVLTAMVDMDVAVAATLAFTVAAGTLGLVSWLALRRETSKRTP